VDRGAVKRSSGVRRPVERYSRATVTSVLPDRGSLSFPQGFQAVQ
jgi:hypothetical protein